MSAFWIIVIVIAVICYVDHVEKRMKRLNRDHENLVNRLHDEAKEALAAKERELIRSLPPVDISKQPKWWKDAFGHAHD